MALDDMKSGKGEPIDLGAHTTFDGFKGKKVFKYQQYNAMIKLKRQGKRRFNPEDVMLGKGQEKKAATWRRVAQTLNSGQSGIKRKRSAERVNYQVQYPSSESDDDGGQKRIRRVRDATADVDVIETGSARR